jgi:hypothetical protein
MNELKNMNENLPEIKSTSDFDCTLVCIYFKKCFQASIKRNIDIERDSKECKKLGGLKIVYLSDV